MKGVKTMMNATPMTHEMMKMNHDIKVQRVMQDYEHRTKSLERKGR